MGRPTTDVATLDELFVNGLRVSWLAENRIAAALPTLTAPKLKNASRPYLGGTDNQVGRVGQVFARYGVWARQLGGAGRAAVLGRALAEERGGNAKPTRGADAKAHARAPARLTTEMGAASARPVFPAGSDRAGTHDEEDDDG